MYLAIPLIDAASFIAPITKSSSIIPAAKWKNYSAHEAEEDDVSWEWDLGAYPCHRGKQICQASCTSLVMLSERLCLECSHFPYSKAAEAIRFLKVPVIFANMKTLLWACNFKIIIPWWLRAMRPREQEREQDSKCTALLGTPALGTNLKATTDLVKMGGKR